MDPEALGALIAREARDLGFDRVGLVPAERPRRFEAYEAWLCRGDHGEMDYMAREDHVRGRRDPQELLPGARTLVAVALAYAPGEPRSAARAGPDVSADRLRGKVARYARGDDYHRVLKARLNDLGERLRAACGDELRYRACVDTAPVLERDAAERAGVGFTAKNTMVIAPGLGSYFVLGELLLSAPARLPPRFGDRPAGDPSGKPARAPIRGGCGGCRACLDACPTGAFSDAYILDARRCISYLTIEHRGPIPRELRPLMGTWIFGCDICQEVCPYNAAAPFRAAPAPELGARAEFSAPELTGLLRLNGNQYKRWVRGTALERARRGQLLRNVCVALGNAGSADAIPDLEAALCDRSALVRGHAAWALGALGAGDRCARRAADEADAWVAEELALAAGAREDAPEDQDPP